MGMVKPPVVLRCDRCDVEAQASTHDGLKAENEMMRLGWVRMEVWTGPDGKDAGQWKEIWLCPDCATEVLKDIGLRVNEWRMLETI